MTTSGSAAPIALAPCFAPSNAYSFRPLSLTTPTSTTTPISRADGDATAAGVDDGVAGGLGVGSAADEVGSFEGSLPPHAMTRMTMLARRLRRMEVTRIAFGSR